MLSIKSDGRDFCFFSISPKQTFYNILSLILYCLNSLFFYMPMPFISLNSFSPYAHTLDFHITFFSICPRQTTPIHNLILHQSNYTAPQLNPTPKQRRPQLHSRATPASLPQLTYKNSQKKLPAYTDNFSNYFLFIILQIIE